MKSSSVATTPDLTLLGKFFNPQILTTGIRGESLASRYDSALGTEGACGGRAVGSQGAESGSFAAAVQGASRSAGFGDWGVWQGKSRGPQSQTRYTSFTLDSPKLCGKSRGPQRRMRFTSCTLDSPKLCGKSRGPQRRRSALLLRHGRNPVPYRRQCTRPFFLPRGPHFPVSLSAVGARTMKGFIGTKGVRRSVGPNSVRPRSG